MTRSERDLVDILSVLCAGKSKNLACCLPKGSLWGVGGFCEATLLVFLGSMKALLQSSAMGSTKAWIVEVGHRPEISLV